MPKWSPGASRRSLFYTIFVDFSMSFSTEKQHAFIVVFGVHVCYIFVTFVVHSGFILEVVFSIVSKGILSVFFIVLELACMGPDV